MRLALLYVPFMVLNFVIFVYCSDEVVLVWTTLLVIVATYREYRKSTERLELAKSLEVHTETDLVSDQLHEQK